LMLLLTGLPGLFYAADLPVVMIFTAQTFSSGILT
jgi:hypothetical protein